MPIYNYKCSHCEHIFDELMSIDILNSINCPKCGHLCYKILFTGNMLIKGDGFYQSTTFRQSK